MILNLFFACILPGKELVGDSDRPFDPSISDVYTELNAEEAAEEGTDPDNETSVGGEDNDSEDSGGNDEEIVEVADLQAIVEGDFVYVIHSMVDLHCDFSHSEIQINTDMEAFHIEVIYSDREPQDCTYSLSYRLNFEGAPSGSYLLEAHGDEASFTY